MKKKYNLTSPAFEPGPATEQAAFLPTHPPSQLANAHFTTVLRQKDSFQLLKWLLLWSRHQKVLCNKNVYNTKVYKNAHTPKWLLNLCRNKRLNFVYQVYKL